MIKLILWDGVISGGGGGGPPTSYSITKRLGYYLRRWFR